MRRAVGDLAPAMHRAFRQIGERLDSLRLTVLDRIHAYERGEVPVDVPIVLLARHAAGEPLRWTAQQTYLNPSPAIYGAGRGPPTRPS